MDFVGKVILDLKLEEGISRVGNPWKKKSWVAETFGQYPRKVKMDAMNATLDNLHIEVGKVYTFSVDVESREYNGKWYSDVRVYRAVETQDPTQSYSQPAVNTAAAPAADPFTAPAADPFASAPGAPGAAAFGDASDDLPF